jgi:MurNAc alpha-1-phosphate uridylyltransferase
MKKITKAMIFAAGFGKRLVPLTEKTPKPLLQLNGKTLLENCILFLEDCGIKEIVINVHHLAGQIIEFINKNKFKSKIHISHEKEKILGTGGGLIYAKNNIKNFFQRRESFITINPDTLWNSNYVSEFNILEEWHFKCKMAEFVLLLVPKNNCYEIREQGDFDLKYPTDDKDREHTTSGVGGKQYPWMSEIALVEKNNINNYIYTGLQIVRIEGELYNGKKKVSGLDRDNLNERDFWTINENWEQGGYLCGYASKQKFYHVSNLETFNNLKKEKIITY